MAPWSERCKLPTLLAGRSVLLLLHASVHARVLLHPIAG